MKTLRFVQVSRRDDGLVRVTLDRSSGNAIDRELIEELSVVAEALSGPDTQVVLLCSALPVFMAGADLNMIDSGWSELPETIRALQEMMNRWEAIPAATIAVINGHALGGGCELAMTCGWRLMARGKARIGLPEVRLGVLPAGGGTQRMTRLVGPGRALDLCSRGVVVDADEAERIGLVSQAVDAGSLDARAVELAEELLKLPRLTIHAIKRCILGRLEADLAAGLTIEAEEMVRLGGTDDAREGVRAFIEKRLPVFGHR